LPLNATGNLEHIVFYSCFFLFQFTAFACLDLSTTIHMDGQGQRGRGQQERAGEDGAGRGDDEQMPFSDWKMQKESAMRQQDRDKLFTIVKGGHLAYGVEGRSLRGFRPAGWPLARDTRC